MGYRYVVLGTGRQGVALAYDLAKNGEADSIVLADSDAALARRAARRLKRLLPRTRCRFEPRRCDVAQRAEVLAAARGAKVLLSAVPYRFNAQLARWALEARASFLDLGGNTAVVRAELALDARARRAGISIVPDCGLAPGLGNQLAAHGIAQLERPEHVHVRCGGLPARPVGPLGYKLVFNFYGLWNEYRGFGEFLRNGKRALVPALSELETGEYGALGTLEAAVTSGGTSTCAETWKGLLQSFDYKTLRYPGHWQQIRTLFALGFLDERFRARDGREFEPLELARRLFEAKLAFPKVHDLVVLRTTVEGRQRGRARELRYDVLERYDARTGFTAMERATAFPAALVAHLQARGLVEPGARPLEVAVPAQRFLSELPRHGIRVRRSAR